MKQIVTKERIDFLELFPPEYSSTLIKNKEIILSNLKETMLVYYKSGQYSNITKELLPDLKALIKVYKPTKQLKEVFIEILAKLILHPTHEITAKELLSTIKVLETLLKGKSKVSFNLPWESMLELLLTFNNEGRASHSYPPQERLEIMQKLPRLIGKLRKYLSNESGIEIFEYVKSFIGPPKAQGNLYILYLDYLIRTDHKLAEEHYEPWLKEMLKMLEDSAFYIFSPVALSVISRLAKSHYEIQWDQYIDMLFTRINDLMAEDVNTRVNLPSTFPKIEGNSKNNKSAARLIISMLRPQDKGPSRVFGYLKELINTLKVKQSAADSSFNFISSLLFCMCNRLKIERAVKNIKEDQKLKPIDIQQFTEIIMDTLDPCLLSAKTKKDILTSVGYIGYLYPEKAFDWYIPRMLGHLEDYKISHEPVLDFLNVLVMPLLLTKDLPKKFYYLRLILESSMKEIITIESIKSLTALEIIGKIFTFIPLTDSLFMKQAYERVGGKGVSYDKFLSKKEPESYYHELLNTTEAKACDILGKVLTLLKNKEKRDVTIVDNLNKRVEDIINALCNNTTKELFKVLLEKVKELITSDTFPNAKGELAVVIKAFARRDSLTANTLIPLLFKKLTFKDTSDQWKGGVGKFIESSLAKWYEDAKMYSLNDGLPKEKLSQYTQVISNILSEDPNAYKEHKAKINTLLALLLVDKSKKRQAKELFQSILLGQLSFSATMKIIDEDKILEAYKTIGEFDSKKLKLEWKVYTKEAFEICRELIQFIGIELGEYALGLSGSESNEVVVTWLKALSIIVPSCLSWIQKEGTTNFDFTLSILRKATDNDESLIEFFKTLRRQLMSLALKVVGKVIPTLANQANQKLANKIFKCLLSLSNIDRIHNELDVYPKLLPIDKKTYKDPTIKGNVRKYTYYYRKTSYLLFGITRRFQRINESPFNELKSSLHCLLDILNFIITYVNFIK